jgi:hypothetical protein
MLTTYFTTLNIEDLLIRPLPTAAAQDGEKGEKNEHGPGLIYLFSILSFFLLYIKFPYHRIFNFHVIFLQFDEEKQIPSIS